MERRLRLRIWLLSLVLPMVGPNGVLRMLLVSILRMGRMGWRCRRQRGRGLGKPRLFAYGRSLGESLHRELRRCDERRLSQYTNRQEHDRWEGLQHQYLHGEHLRIPRWRHLQPEHWYRRRRRSWICGQHLHRAGHGWARPAFLQHPPRTPHCSRGEKTTCQDRRPGGTVHTEKPAVSWQPTARAA